MEEKDYLEQLRTFFEKNKIAVAVVLIAVLGGFGGFAYFESKSKADQQEANALLVSAEQYFAQDSFSLALNGDGINPGFLEIADSYSNTKVGNTANMYVGISYFKLGDTASAQSYLESFSSESSILNAKKYEVLGTIYSEQGDTEAAKNAYMKAMNVVDVDVLAAYYTNLLADYLAYIEDYSGAYEYYSKVKSDYPNTDEGRSADKLVALMKSKL